MKEIAIYGAGGLGREVACIIDKINEQHPTWNLIGFFDDGKEIGTPISHYGIVRGGIEELNAWERELAIVIGIGMPHLVENIIKKIFNPRIFFPNIIHPTFYVADASTIHMGKGNVIARECFFSCDVQIGDFNVLNALTSFGHDVKIGSYNSFMSAVRISGEVTIGNTNFFGVNAVVLQQIKVGNGIRVGAGSVIISRPKDGQLYIGNPAKCFKY